jgi:large subunit ribosomal protein L4e
MKAHLYSPTGEKKSEISLPSVFDAKVREDLAAKLFEAQKFEQMQPYSTYEEAGKRHSASGTISHRRHKWKGHYGKGISRAPRKKMWRRGTQFFWIGAEVSQARGGRVAHPPSGLHRYRKINDKEKTIAFSGALASTFHPAIIKKRYSSLSAGAEPAVIESLPAKTKDLISILNKIFAHAQNLLLKKKSVRSGKGKSRGRKYKSNAGLLVVIGKDEKAKFSGVDVKPLQNVNIADLYPLGRLTLYTKKAIEELRSKQ